SRRHTRSKRDWSSDVCSSDLDPALAFCAASGSTAARYGHTDLGRIEPGRRADLVILDSPLGGQGEDAFDAMREGNVPAVAGVLRSEERRVGGERATRQLGAPG